MFLLVFQFIFSSHMDRYVFPYRANGFLRLMLCTSRQGPIESPSYSSGGFKSLITYHVIDCDGAILGRNHNFGFR